MKEWDVYADGRYIGTVHESNEDLARCAAYSKFEIGETASLSVSPR